MSETREQIVAQVSARKQGHPGPLSRACYDERDEDCGLWGCQCRCHYVEADILQRMWRSLR